MVKSGKTHDEITEYMIARYGDFVLYRPPVNPTTYLLWIGPFVFLLLALIALFYFIRRKSSSNNAPTVEQLKSARKYLDN
jgi:cytochrome c-type biogenesis protein CcmH